MEVIPVPMNAPAEDPVSMVFVIASLGFLEMIVRSLLAQINAQATVSVKICDAFVTRVLLGTIALSCAV